MFHALAGRDEYLPYTGICLTDTFALHEGDDKFSDYLQDNSDRRERQKATEIRVIIGNPPYSAGQKSENDNAKNVTYARLDQRIRSTYAERSNASLLQNLYDSYIRAIRWGSDRLGKAGVMAIVTGSAWIERAFADGMRKCLADEFSSVHVFHLRGDIRKEMISGGRAGEGENVFGQGSMTGVAITVFIKNPDSDRQGQVLFHDIGDRLNREVKLSRIKGLRSIAGIGDAGKWTTITPDEHGDWLDQRDPRFKTFLNIGDKDDATGRSLFSNYSLGVVTNRDAWCINPSRTTLTGNVEETISFYNSELTLWKEATAGAKATGAEVPVRDVFINRDPTRISWTRSLKTDLEKEKSLEFGDGQIVPCQYRPFNKQWQFYSRRLNEMVYQMPRIFPNGNLPNRVIAVTGRGGRSGFSVLMMDALPNLHTIDTCQCFPFWLYEKAEDDLLADEHPGYRRQDAITDYGLECFRKAYPSETITREDIFHYVYGLLHSEDYRSRFAANLVKDLPRIPCVKPVEDYRAFRDAGKRLGKLHLGYETVEPYEATIDTGGKLLVDDAAYRVVKMRHPGSGKNTDRSSVIYNAHITIREIPEDAWDYVVNGKPALTWVMERQCVKTDKASGIVSDANRYATETVGDARYPLDLFLRVITVSLETIKIVRSLPELVID